MHNLIISQIFQRLELSYVFKTHGGFKGLISCKSLVFCWAGQRRTMFIQTQSTPNPSSLMFYPGKPVMEVGSADFPNVRSALGSPLAKSIYSIDGIIIPRVICSFRLINRKTFFLQCDMMFFL